MEQEKRREIEEELKRVKVAFKNLFSTDDGEVVLKALKDIAYIDRTFYRRGASEIDLAYCEGARSVVLFILQMIKEGGKYAG